MSNVRREREKAFQKCRSLRTYLVVFHFQSISTNFEVEDNTRLEGDQGGLGSYACTRSVRRLSVGKLRRISDTEPDLCSCGG